MDILDFIFGIVGLIAGFFGGRLSVNKQTSSGNKSPNVKGKGNDVNIN